MLPLLASLTRALPEGARLALGGPDVEGEPLALSLSVKTVSTYRTRVMEKMQLASNSDLTYYALKNGLIQ